MALIALVQRTAMRDRPRQVRRWSRSGAFGAALFYGDGMITPAISVLSAVEGLEVAAPGLDDAGRPDHAGDPRRAVRDPALRHRRGRPAVRAGDAASGSARWRCSALAEVVERARRAARAVAAPTRCAFFARPRRRGVPRARLGRARGHRRRGAVRRHGPLRPRRRSGGRGSPSCCPALMLNYFGQGALLLGDPEAADNPFYRLVPGWAQMPMVVLATAAAIIASQAVISGAFSVTRQAVQLGFLPRLTIRHTSEQRDRPDLRAGGQLGAVRGDRRRSSSASAPRRRSPPRTGSRSPARWRSTPSCLRRRARCCGSGRCGWRSPAPAAFLVVDLAFFAANVTKIPHGGWFPLRRRAALFARDDDVAARPDDRHRATAPRPRAPLATSSARSQEPTTRPSACPGTAVFLQAKADTTPLALR